MQKKHFTLVELLAVVAIIGILAGILLPVLSGSQLRGKITQAKSDMRTIETALEALAADNGGRYMISTAGRRGNTYAWGGHTMTSSNGVVKIIGENLRYMLVELSDPDSTGITFSNNKRKIRYMDPPKDYQGTITSCDWLDPWGTNYNVWICVDGSGKLTPHTGHNVYSNVILWSYGPDGANNEGANTETDNCLSGTTDDVASWHK